MKHPFKFFVLHLPIAGILGDDLSLGEVSLDLWGVDVVWDLAPVFWERIIWILWNYNYMMDHFFNMKNLVSLLQIYTGILNNKWNELVMELKFDFKVSAYILISTEHNKQSAKAIYIHTKIQRYNVQAK